MAKHESVVTVKIKADTSELIAALEEAEDRVDALYAKLAKVRRAKRGKGAVAQGGPAAARRETRLWG